MNQCWLAFISVMFFFVFKVDGGEAKYASWIESRHYGANDGYVSEVKVVGKRSENQNTISIPFTDLYKIESLVIEFFSEKSQKWKRVSPKEIKLSDLRTSSFIDDAKHYTTLVPGNTRFRFSYSLIVEDRMLTTPIVVSSYRIDSFHYDISIPFGFELYWYKDVIEDEFNIDLTEVEDDEGTYYSLNTISLETSRNDHIRLPFSVTKKGEDPFQAFQKWNAGLRSGLESLNPSSKSIIDSLCAGKEKHLEIAKTLFEYCQRNIRYVAVESGYSGWCPRSANITLANKRGDCKDMAHFLELGLLYKGIEAYSALVHTLSSKANVVYPAIGFANHAICISIIGGDTLILDATDDDIPFGFSSRHTQGSSYLLLSEPHGIHTVPMISSAEVAERYNLHLTCNRIGHSEGNGEYHSTPLIIGTEFDGAQVWESIENDEIEMFLSRSFKEFSVMGIEKEGTENAPVHYRLENEKMILNQVGGDHYLRLNAFDGLFLKQRDATEIPAIQYLPQNEEFVFEIKFDSSVKLIVFSEADTMVSGDFTFRFLIESTSSDKILLRYSYVGDSLKLNEDNLADLNNVATYANEFFDRYVLLFKD